MKSMSRKARTGLAVALVALVMLVIIVGSSAASSSGGIGTTAKVNHNLVVLESGVAPTLDYDGPNAAQPQTQEVVVNLMDPLVTYPTKPDGKFVVEQYKESQAGFAPALAASYQEVNPTTFVFHLRKSVYSCAGNQLTSADVVYTFGRAKSVSGAAPIGWFLSNAGGIFDASPLAPNAPPAAKALHGEVTALDKYTVRIKLLQPNELFPRVLAIFALGIFDSKTMKQHATSADPWAHNYTLTQNIPGFGAYCLKSWTQGSSMTLSANPRYYGGKPQFTTVTIRSVPQETDRVAAIESGGADLTYPITPNEAKSIASNPTSQVLSHANNELVELGMNNKIPPWSLPTNKLLRQAVAYALPYKQIISSVYDGNAKQAFGAFPPNYNGFIPIKTYSTNLAKAKQLLAKAGFPGGKGLSQYASGLQLNYVSERSALLEPLVNQIRTALAAVGIPITLNPIPSVDMNSRELQKGDLPMWIRDQLVPLGTDVGFAAGAEYASPTAGGTAVAGNYTGIDKLYLKSKLTTGSARVAVLKQIQTTLMTDLPLVPILQYPTTFAARKGIANIELRPDSLLLFHTITG